MKLRRLWIGLGVVVTGIALMAIVLLAMIHWPRPDYNTASGGLALAGYDPVSYFSEGGGEPRPGNPSLSAEHGGRRYYFASEENRGRFLASPERYEPQYGGWCAQAVAGGYKFEVDPESYLVVDDRLLLFYRGMLGDARVDFEEAGARDSLRQADENWPMLLAK